ncbi:MAG: ADP-ribosylglycohydrolase family protein [Planctomycetes bacterium]|nr:ADP-ribosylglycohydrolase family protein [Planctomycetota bacterium]
MARPLNILWIYVSEGDLAVERQQCIDEGKDISPLVDEFDRLAALDLMDRANQPAAAALLARTAALPVRPDFPYDEPSDLAGIRAACPGDGPDLPPINSAALADSIHGAWLGRICGCLLGKPVEGWRRERMWTYLKDTGRWPLTDYFSLSVPDEVRQRAQMDANRPFIENVSFMPIDDDTNYTVVGLKLMQQHGRNFTPADVASFWMGSLPILATCTAERAAYRNFAMNIAPPDSATHCNVYREWIGAQIRADAFGYACPGDPQAASELAWRDACISHVKNGIYGEMWAAAMVAAALVCDDVPTIIRAGLARVPARCRLAEDVQRMLNWHAEGVGYDNAVERIHKRWDENTDYGWCHTISNAMAVAAGLLYGEGDYEKSICRAVQACFDTDCNSATVGSIVGAMLGAEALPAKWTGVVNNTLETSITGFNRVKISDMAQQTLALINGN